MSRQLDKAIAEALGYIPCDKWNTMQSTIFMGDIYNKNCDHEKCYPTKQPIAYSTDGNAMLELDREMRERKYLLTDAVYVFSDKGWYARYKSVWDDFLATADTEPLARALAAYKALTGKDWEEEGE